jgi:uncharacterized protein (DUF302 family)
MTVEGLKVSKSHHAPRETLEQLEVAIGHYGMKVYARIDHGAVAASAGLELRPAVVVLFGNPQAATPLIEGTPTIAIDLPLRILVWQDSDGTTWLGYNDPLWVARRHDLADDGSAGLAAEVLSAIASEAATR